MRKFSTALLGAALAAASLFGPTAARAGTSTYTNLVWSTNLDASGLRNCDQLVIDATGDYYGSGALVLYGSLNCSNGAYGVTGSLYTAVDDSLSITLLVAGYTVVCPRVVGFSGNCSVYDSSWIVRGTGSIQLT